MATYTNDLRLKEITTGDEDGTWGTSTNTNLSLIADAFGYGTKEVAADADETFTMPDATADGTRAMYLKFTSAVSLTVTRTITLAPNTVSKVWLIENATSGSQSITIKQGSGATVTIATGAKALVYTDGAGAGGAVVLANPTAAVVNLATGVTGILPVANGGTGITSFGTGVATALGQNVSGTGGIVLGTAPSGDLVGTTATQTLTGKTIRDTVYSLSGTAFDATNGAIQTKTLAAIVTFTDSLTSGDAIVLMLEGGATYAVTWPTTTWVTSGGNVAPTLTAKDTLVFWKISTTLYGAYTGSYV
jgi:hypothetical protein